MPSWGRYTPRRRIRVAYVNIRSEEIAAGSAEGRDLYGDTGLLWDRSCMACKRRRVTYHDPKHPDPYSATVSCTRVSCTRVSCTRVTTSVSPVSGVVFVPECADERKGSRLACRILGRCGFEGRFFEKGDWETMDRLREL